MKIGISVASAYPAGDPRDGAKHMVDRTRAAASANLDSLFVGDHHVVSSPYYQNMPMMGRMLAEWHSRPAGVLVLLPLWHPVLVAEQVATLACIHEAPFILQCGLGRSEAQFQAMSANIKYRPSAFEQSLGCLRALWRGETVSLDGRWRIINAHISPLPPEAVEVWIGASADVAIDRAARLGDVWLAEPGLTLADAGRSMNVYRNALAQHNKPTPKTIAIRRDIYVAENQQEAQQVRQTIARNYRGFDPEALIVGHAAAVAEAFRDVEALGFTDIIVRNLHPDPSSALLSTQRLKQVKVLLDNFT
jgi:alkanesulfonate monooxygenase SsuD/methylene tetrahydromethanopterin reductase-like flavin-dependent oxidoreductase (luciferase family)